MDLNTCERALLGVTKKKWFYWKFNTYKAKIIQNYTMTLKYWMRDCLREMREIETINKKWNKKTPRRENDRTEAEYDTATAGQVTITILSFKYFVVKIT